MNIKLSQRGFSLIEILIALTLSIIIILAMLRAFATTGKVTAEASLGAKVDSQIILGLITVDRLLQGLGYGMTNPTHANFKVLNAAGSEVADGQPGKILVWKISATHCRALQSNEKGLYLYGVTDAGYDCSGTGLVKPDEDDDDISKEPLIQINQEALTNSGIANATNKIGTINIKAQQVAGCSPFGVKSDAGALLGKYQVVITAHPYAASTDSTARTIENITCLFNFK